MKKDYYNLQVPIDKTLETTLKELAEEDDRSLRSYCKKILQEHVNRLNLNIKTNSSKINIQNKSQSLTEEENLLNNKNKIKGF